MAKKYGGVDNKQSFNQIQEAVVVDAPIVQKKMPKSKAGTIFGWLVYYFITWLITWLFLMATGISEQNFYRAMPLWAEIWLIPSLPFIITLISVLINAHDLKRKKAGG